VNGTAVQASNGLHVTGFYYTTIIQYDDDDDDAMSFAQSALSLYGLQLLMPLLCEQSVYRR